MNLKRLSFLLMTFLLLVVLVACGGKDNEGKKDDKKDDKKDPKDNTEEPADEPVDVTDANVEDTGFPIAKETVDMKIFANKPLQNEDNDWNDILIWNRYKEDTNVNVEWQEIHPDALDETRNIALSGGDLPDAFFLAGVPVTDLLKYGEDGTFVALNDYIDKYAPNLTALMEADPSIRKAITFPDGNIYSMPSLIQEDFLSLRLGARPWINQVHLDELGMDMPTTTDEFYDFLVGIKELAPAGADTIPYGGTAIGELVEWLAGSFGVMNKGAINANYDLGEDGDIRFYANTDDYKELITYLNKLYEEELIDQQILSNDWSHFTGLAGEGAEVFSAYVFYEPIDFFNQEIGEKWEAMAALKGPNGHEQYNKVAASVWVADNLVITKKNDSPAAAVRWMDHFYSPEGSQLYYMGVEDETFEIVNGEAVYMEHILNPEGGKVFEQAIVEQLTWIGSINGIITQEYFAGGESNARSMEAAEKIAPFTPDEIWPAFTFTPEENEILTTKGSDIATAVLEYRDQFIAGQLSIESDWDAYVAELDAIGLADVEAVYQEAFKRYSAE